MSLSANVVRTLEDGYLRASNIATPFKTLFVIVVSSFASTVIARAADNDTTLTAQYAGYATAIVLVALLVLWLARLIRSSKLDRGKFDESEVWVIIVVLFSQNTDLFEILVGNLVAALINMVWEYGSTDNILASLVAMVIVLFTGWVVVLTVKTRTHHTSLDLHRAENPHLTAGEAEHQIAHHLEQLHKQRNEHEILGVTIRVTAVDEDQPHKHFYLPDDTTRVGAKRGRPTSATATTDRW